MFSWFMLKDAEGNTNPLYTGYERLSSEGTQFLMHDEIAIRSGAKLAKTSIMPTKIALDAQVLAKTIVLNEAICTKDAIDTKALLATAEWIPKEVLIDTPPVKELPIEEVVVKK